jgi:hypothetical protein
MPLRKVGRRAHACEDMDEDCKLKIENCKLQTGGIHKKWNVAFCLTLLAILAVECFIAVDPAHCAAQKWAEQRRAGPFLCHSEFSLGGVDGLLKELMSLQTVVADSLKIPKAEGPVDVYFFTGKPSYDRYVKSNLPDVPYRKALYVKRAESVMVLAYVNADFISDVRHECTHALLHAVLPMVPLWLDEGLAKYYELPAEQRVPDNLQMSKLRKNIRLGGMQSLEKLESLSNMNDMGAEEYQAAWCWIHFLLHGSTEGHEELIKFVADIQANIPPGRLSERLRKRSPDIGDRFTAYFQPLLEIHRP